MAIQLSLLDRPDGRTSILTGSGFVIDLIRPDATGLPVEDVAYQLACQPRWAGATWHAGRRCFYSVAEHSVLVSRLVPAVHAWDGLWHDAIEAFTGDWPTPIKNVMGRELVHESLAPLERALAKRFAFRRNLACVKKADLIAAATELRDLLPPRWIDFSHLPAPSPEPIVPLGPDLAYTAFMARYEELKRA